jgi:homoserine dehydrogenase
LADKLKRLVMEGQLLFADDDRTIHVKDFNGYDVAAEICILANLFYGEDGMQEDGFTNKKYRITIEEVE